MAKIWRNGPANLYKSACGFALVEDLLENDETLQEKIETHEELNPKLFDKDNKLLPEVLDKLEAIIDRFTQLLSKNGIKITVKDVILTGSNANFNYTENSDIDLHIIADTKDKTDPDKLYPALYDAYRNLFSKKYEITIKDIPVEVYVETEDSNLTSGGIYSILDNNWLKEPEVQEIPEIDWDKFYSEYEEQEAECQDLLHKEFPLETTEEDIDEYISSLYELRQKSLKTDGEFGIGNLVFKELRNNGYLDKLKQLRDEIVSRELSLEGYAKLNKPVESDYLEEDYISGEDLLDYKLYIEKLTNKTPLIDAKGSFCIYNLKESDANKILKILKNTQQIQEAYKQLTNKFELSGYNPKGNTLPETMCNIKGKIKK